MIHALSKHTSEISAGLLLKAGIDPLPTCGKDVVTRALSRYSEVGINAVQASQEILDLIGMPRPRNHADLIEAAFSSSEGSNIFDGVVNAALIEPFAANDSTQGWITEQELADFRMNIRVRRENVEQMKLLSRGKQAEHLNPQFASNETYKAHRFARRFVVDSRALIDQDVAALSEPSRLFGKASLSLKRDLVYSVLLANANLSDGVALFHANHGNLRTGSALSAANLDAAMAVMENLAENGQSVDAMPRYLLVPSELRGLAMRLNRDMSNPLIVRSDSRLSNGVTDPVSGTTYAGSATTWFLAITKSPLEFGFLESRLPRIRSTALTQGGWGVSYDVFYDVGSTATGHFGLQKNTA